MPGGRNPPDPKIEEFQVGTRCCCCFPGFPRGFAVPPRDIPGNIRAWMLMELVPGAEGSRGSWRSAGSGEEKPRLCRSPTQRQAMERSPPPPGQDPPALPHPKNTPGAPTDPPQHLGRAGLGGAPRAGLCQARGLRVGVPGVTPPQALVMDGGPQGGKCGVSCAGRGVGAGKAPPEVGPARGGGRGGVGAKEFLTFQQPGGVTAAGGGAQRDCPLHAGGRRRIVPRCPSGEVFGGKSWIFGGSLVPRGALDSQTGRSRSQR